MGKRLGVCRHQCSCSTPGPASELAGDLGPIPSSRELHFLSVGLSALWFKLISDSGVVTALELRQPHGSERRNRLALFLVFLECELSVGEGLWETRLGEES